jgi:uncharacterized membrane protein YqjE
MSSVPHQDYAASRPLLGLVSDLWRETATLVQEEAELAKAELSEKVSQVTSGAGEIAVGGAILFAGFMMLLLAAAGALLIVLPEPHSYWLAPLIVAAAVMVIGAIALARGRANMKARNLAPRRTLQSLRRDANLAKEHMS